MISAPDLHREHLEIIERIEGLTPGGGGDRAQLAEQIETFTDARVFRYWELVAIVNGWPESAPGAQGAAEAWQWYAHALRAHA
jgi:hypothetical protein